MDYCEYCKKEFDLGDYCWHVKEECCDICYQPIDNVEDVENTCLGKYLMNFGYSKEFIHKLLLKDLDDREIQVYLSDIFEL